MTEKEKINSWINIVLNEVSKLDSNKGIEILDVCGANCSKTSPLLEGAKKVNNEFGNDKDDDVLFNAYKTKFYNTPRLTKNGNEITLIFEECTCPMVKQGVDNPFLCNCTVGYTKNIFTVLFGKTVHVNLKCSILRGDDICEQVIEIE